MKKETKPKVRVTILPDVYDPERYRRGMASLRVAFNRAVANRYSDANGKPLPE